MIAAAGTVNGEISANGGSWGRNGESSGGGSGGAIKIISTAVAGSGGLFAFGLERGGNDATGGLGRIRVEAVTYRGGLNTVPAAVVEQLIDGAEPRLWVPEEQPAIRIAAVAGLEVAVQPVADTGFAGADVYLETEQEEVIRIETTHVDSDWTVTVRVVPSNGALFELPATFSGTPGNWAATGAFPKGHSTVQARATAPE